MKGHALDLPDEDRLAAVDVCTSDSILSSFSMEGAGSVRPVVIAVCHVHVATSTTRVAARALGTGRKLLENRKSQTLNFLRYGFAI